MQKQQCEAVVSAATKTAASGAAAAPHRMFLLRVQLELPNRPTAAATTTEAAAEAASSAESAAAVAVADAAATAGSNSEIGGGRSS